MGSGRQRSASGLSANFARTILLSVLFFNLTSSAVRAQFNRQVPDYTDPDQFAITAKRRSIEQGEKNIRNQQLCLDEFEIKAQKIRNRLEALSYQDEISPRLQEYAAEMNRELKSWNGMINSIKIGMDAQANMLEEDKRQLKAEEKLFKQKKTSFESRQLGGGTGDDYLERVNQQNERLLQEVEEREKQIDLQNQRLMRDVEIPPRHGQVPPNPLPTVDNRYDLDEVKW
jgi:hypothetical protein